MENKLVWSDEEGDLRKKKSGKSGSDETVNEGTVLIELRRLTTGKGRTVIELSCLPSNKNWCKKLAKELKKTIGVGGSYKDAIIEVHGEKFDEVSKYLDKRNLKWKRIGG